MDNRHADSFRALAPASLLGTLVLAGLAVWNATCHQAILTAPPGSTMTLFANPPFSLPWPACLPSVVAHCMPSIWFQIHHV